MWNGMYAKSGIVADGREYKTAIQAPHSVTAGGVPGGSVKPSKTAVTASVSFPGLFDDEDDPPKDSGCTWDDDTSQGGSS